MCGIVGYVGDNNVYDILIKGLHRLEYRGYDSAGIALANPNGKINIYKSQGKVSNLEDFCKDKNLEAKSGIAHTRWATHGEPSDNNAHPHFSEDGNLALVHNGTIENYQVLKDALIAHGCTFHSETDTEVLVQLIEYIKIKNNCDLVDAVREALKQVIGAYAIALIEKDNPNRIIAARNSSPLAVGIGENETFLASDATPFIEYTKDCVYLKDGEIAIIEKGEPLKILTLENKESKIDVTTLEPDETYELTIVARMGDEEWVVGDNHYLFQAPNAAGVEKINGDDEYILYSIDGKNVDENNADKGIYIKVTKSGSAKILK